MADFGPHMQVSEQATQCLHGFLVCIFPFPDSCYQVRFPPCIQRFCSPSCLECCLECIFLQCCIQHIQRHSKWKSSTVHLKIHMKCMCIGDPCLVWSATYMGAVKGWWVQSSSPWYSTGCHAASALPFGLLANPDLARAPTFEKMRSARKHTRFSSGSARVILSYW